MKKRKTKMRATSIEAFFYILENLIGKRQEQVFKVIKGIQPCSNLMISKKSNLPINCITGRVKELRDFGIVRCYKKDICPETKMRVNYWIIPAWMKDVLM